MKPEYNIIDTTLREGEQAPGVLFSLVEKKNILDGLVRIGIKEAEIGIASPHHTCPASLIDYCRKKHPLLKLSLWSRCQPDDIKHAIKLKPDIISLSIPTSEIHLKQRLKKDYSWVLETVEKSLRQAKSDGTSVSIGFEDATRSDPEFLHQLARISEKNGALRIRLADTVGIASPLQLAGLVESLASNLSSCQIAVHTHNDFGMATGNAIAALEAGAVYADAVVLGLGERTGCARLEELVGYLALTKQQKGLQPEFLKPLAHYIAGLTERNIAGHRPIIGEKIFTCETGLHVHGLQNNPETYEPFQPELVGARRKLLFGSKSGRRAIMQHLSELTAGMNLDIQYGSVARVREAAQKLQRPLKNSEILKILTTN